MYAKNSALVLFMKTKLVSGSGCCGTQQSYIRNIEGPEGEQTVVPEILILGMYLIITVHVRSLIIAVAGNKRNLSENSLNVISRRQIKQKDFEDIPLHIDLFE